MLIRVKRDKTWKMGSISSDTNEESSVMKHSDFSSTIPIIRHCLVRSLMFLSLNTDRHCMIGWEHELWSRPTWRANGHKFQHLIYIFPDTINWQCPQAHVIKLVWSCIYFWDHVFSCDQAALQMVFSVRPSVCLSVRLSVCPSHLFDYVPIIVSSWNFQELLPVTEVTSMQKVKVRGQRSRSQRSQPNFTVSGL